METEKIDLKLAKEIIEKQNKSVRKSTPQGYTFSILFGIAWIIGYGALYYTNLSKLGYIIFASSLFIATIFCLIYLFISLKGIKTKSSKYIAWWSISWWLGFMCHSFIMNSVERQIKDLPESVSNNLSWLLGNSIALLIVCLCYLGAAAVFKNKLAGIVGVIIALTLMISLQLSSSQGALICAFAGLIILFIAIIDLYKIKKLV